MSFDPDWLELRRSADERARAASTEALRRVLPGGRSRVVDLAAGSGNNVRFLAEALAPRELDVTLIDGDRDLLERAADALPMAAEAISVDLATADLAGLVRGADLVTTSAFLDLAGAEWIDRLARELDAAGVPVVLAVLSVDGRVAFTPALPEDEDLGEAFHADMLRDKGLGPALGPGGGARFAEAMGAVGYDVETFDSAWRLSEPADGALMAAYLEGVAEALRRHRDASVVDRWLAARATAGGGGAPLSSVTVGHVDVLCVRRDHLPPSR